MLWQNNGLGHLHYLKAAALEFIDTVLPDNETEARIGIVTYGTYARAYNFSGRAHQYNDKWDLYGATQTNDVYYTKDKNAVKALKQAGNESYTV